MLFRLKAPVSVSNLTDTVSFQRFQSAIGWFSSKLVSNLVTEYNQKSFISSVSVISFPKVSSPFLEFLYNGQNIDSSRQFSTIKGKKGSDNCIINVKDRSSFSIRKQKWIS